MKHYTIRNARAEFADVIGAAQFGGETIEITKHGKPVARVTPVDAVEGPALEAGLSAELDAYATAQGLTRNDAIAALLRAGLAADTTTAKADGIADVFPEMRELDASDAHNLVLEAETDPGETVAYDYDDVEAEYGYAKARGRWIYTVSRPTSATDTLGLPVREHDYTVCKDKRDAKKQFRAAVIEASQQWRAGTEPMWFDAIGETFQKFGRDRAIPLGAWGAECLAE